MKVQGQSNGGGIDKNLRLEPQKYCERLKWKRVELVQTVEGSMQGQIRRTRCGGRLRPHRTYEDTVLFWLEARPIGVNDQTEYGQHVAATTSNFVEVLAKEDAFQDAKQLRDLGRRLTQHVSPTSSDEPISVYEENGYSTSIHVDTVFEVARRRVLGPEVQPRKTLSGPVSGEWSRERERRRMVMVSGRDLRPSWTQEPPQLNMPSFPSRGLHGITGRLGILNGRRRTLEEQGPAPDAGTDRGGLPSGDDPPSCRGITLVIRGGQEGAFWSLVGEVARMRGDVVTISEPLQLETGKGTAPPSVQ